MSLTLTHNLVDNRFTRNCHSCVPIEKDADRIIFNMPGFCRGVLRRDEHGGKGWIGRTVIFTERHYADSREVPSEVDNAKDRWRNILKIAYERLFNMTRDNFAEAGNLDKDEYNNPTSKREYHHYHWHLVPRYEEPIILFGNKYIDLTFKNIFTLDPKDKDNPPNLKDGINVPLTSEQIPLLKEMIQMELVQMIFDERVEARFKPTPKEILDAVPSENVKRLYTNLNSEKSKRISALNKRKVLTMSIIAGGAILILSGLVARRRPVL